MKSSLGGTVPKASTASECDWRHRAFSRKELRWLRDIGKGLFIDHLLDSQELGINIVEDTQWPH